MAQLYLNNDIGSSLRDRLRTLGHDALTTPESGRRQAHDAEQLVYAADLGRIVLTHNARHFLVLQQAWRHWADVWSVRPTPIRAGILAVPQSPIVEVEHMAHEIDSLIFSAATLANRYFEWIPGRGWVPFG